MSGIYHATFVLARMCFAMREVAASPSASAAMRDEARTLASNSAKLFADGYRVLQQHALYTPATAQAGDRWTGGERRLFSLYTIKNDRQGGQS